MLRIDAHQHFWRLSRGDYSWLTPELGPLYQDFLPDNLVPILRRAGIDGTILIQAAPSEAETAFLLALAERHEFILGVVGWVNFEAPDATRCIAALSKHPKLKGLRPMIQDIADEKWMLRPELDAAFCAMIEHDLAFDALVLPRHLACLVQLLKQYPALRTVIDHCAKPEIAAGRFDDWAQDMHWLAQETRVFCKLSGLMTEAGPGWSIATLQPYVQHVLDTFGPDRIIWGSDWPVMTMNGDVYDAWLGACGSFLANFEPGERDAVLGGNAAVFYRCSQKG